MRLTSNCCATVHKITKSGTGLSVNNKHLQMELVLIGNMGFPSGSDYKESACNSGNPGLNPGSRRCPGEGNGNPLQYSFLENSMDRGAWQAIIHGVRKS